MYPPGHVGVGLLVSAVLVFALGPRRSLWVTVFVLVGARIPDIDTVLPIPHHGFTHTLVGVIGISLVLGTVIVAIADGYRQVTGSDVFVPIDRSDLFATSSGAVFLGGLSHVVTDLVSASVVSDSKPIHLLWPLWTGEVRWPLIPARSEFWNYGLLVVGIVVFVVVYTAVHGRTMVSRVQMAVEQ